MPTYHIFYGFAEGSWHGKQLKRELREAGYRYTRRPSRADIIISHSGGCFLIPKRNRAKLVLLINIPFWPGKRLTKSLREKLREDKTYHSENNLHKHWRKKTRHNGRYAVSRAAHIGRMRLRYVRHDYPIPRTPTQQILLVRNEKDSFCSPRIMSQLPQAKDYTFQSLPGGHDDCWHEPTKYVTLIKEHSVSKASHG